MFFMSLLCNVNSTTERGHHDLTRHCQQWTARPLAVSDGHNPSNMRDSSIAGLMFRQHRRRWPSIKPALDQSLKDLFVGSG